MKNKKMQKRCIAMTLSLVMVLSLFNGLSVSASENGEVATSEGDVTIEEQDVLIDETDATSDSDPIDESELGDVSTDETSETEKGDEENSTITDSEEGGIKILSEEEDENNPPVDENGDENDNEEDYDGNEGGNEGITGVPIFGDEGGYSLTQTPPDHLTGERATIGVTFSQTQQDELLRIYLRYDEAENGEFSYISTSFNGVRVEPHKVEGEENVYYFEIVPPEEGSTATLSLEFEYPNGSSGGTLEYWFAAIDKDSSDDLEGVLIEAGAVVDEDKGIIKVSKSNYTTKWTTETAQYDVTKKTYQNGSLYWTEDEKPSIKNLAYEVQFKMDEVQTESGKKATPGGHRDVGVDYVEHADFTDVLQLPQGLGWRDGMANATYSATKNESDGSWTVTAEIGGVKYTVATLMLGDSVPSSQITNVKASWDKTAGTVVLTWRGENLWDDPESNNVNTKEIENLITRITYGEEVIIVDDAVYNYLAGEAPYPGDAESSEPSEGAERSYTFENMDNTVTMELSYYYSDKKHKSSAQVEDPMEIAADGSLTLTKKRDTTGTLYFGQDVKYSIEVKNDSPFTYKTFNQVTDSLDKNHYIKSESMVEIFRDAAMQDDCASVVITAKDVRKTDTTMGGFTVTYNYMATPNTITVQGVDGSTKTITVTDDISALSAQIDEALGEYDVVSDSQYSVDWNIKEGDWPLDDDTEEEQQSQPYQTLKPRDKRSYSMYASFKDTFMLMDGKDDYEDPEKPGFEEQWSGSVTAVNTAETGEEKATTRSPINPEISVKKERTAEQKFRNGTIVDYKITVSHKGGSTYKEIPVLDEALGAQALLVEVDRNPKLADRGLQKFTDEKGITYYVLLPTGEYEGLNIAVYDEKGEEISTYTASAKVEWAKKENADGTPSEEEDLSHTSISTTISIQVPVVDEDGNPKTGEWTDTFVYRMLTNHDLLGLETPNGDGASDDASVKLPIENIVHIRDLYYETDGDVFLVEFDKNIVMGKNDKDEDILEKFSKVSQFDNEYIVTYRLDFTYPKTAEGTVHFTGADFYDILPDTAGAFAWSSQNIRLSYVFNDDVVVTYGGTQLKSGDEAGSEIKIMKAPEFDPDMYKDEQYYVIDWANDFKVSLEPDTGFYVYVTLTFPADNDETWDNYLQKLNKKNEGHSNRNLYVENTLFFYGYPATVSHQMVGKDVKASLQKGVFETGFYAKNPDSPSSWGTYYRRGDRVTYLDDTLNEDGAQLTEGVVTYYVVLYNDGVSNLYLDTIYDVLPEGFAFKALRTSAYYVGSSSYAREIGNSASLSTSTSSSYMYISSGSAPGTLAKGVYVTCVSETLVDGHNVLAFELSMSESNKKNPMASTTGIGYDPNYDNGPDEEPGRYYLTPGCYIQFGYECATGGADDSKIEATNTIAMPLTGRENEETELDKVKAAKVNTSGRNRSTIVNDGDKEFWDNTTALNKGFSHMLKDGTPFGDNWLGSEVTVRRGQDILPGIEKTGRRIDDTNAEWTVKAYNEGATVLGNYQIVDRMQLPYQFVGDIYYYNYTTNASSGSTLSSTSSNNNLLSKAGSNGVLLQINRDEYGDPNVVTLLSNAAKAVPVTLDLNPLSPNYGKTVTLYFDIQYETGHVEKNVPATVSITVDDTWQILTLTFEDARWGITSTGYIELELQTENITDPVIPRDQVPNEAMLFPADEFDSSLVTKGDYIVENGKPGVKDEASISVMVDTPTASYKEIIELDDELENQFEDQYASSLPGDNDRFVLTGKEKIVRYTLNVQSSSDNAMDQLVLIDNLPEGDDANPLFDQARGSAFKVSLNAENPNFEVVRYSNPASGKGEVLDPSMYEVQYRAGETSGGFNHNDWSGGEASEWHTYTPGTTTEEELASARDLRVIVYGWVDKEGGTKWEPGDTSNIQAKIPALDTNSKLTFSFNALIPDPDEADYGDIAWNSFGYEYFTVLENSEHVPESHYLYAAPRKVGISIPGVPVLSKVITKSNGAPAVAESDLTFKYLVYTGKAIDFADFTEETVGKALTELLGTNDERTFTYVTVDVETGSSSSEQVKLADLKQYEYADGAFTETEASFDWIQGSQYTIVELTTENSDNGFVFKSVKEGISITSERNHTFTYDAKSNLTIEYNNGIPTWGVDLLKTDDQSSETPLEGAIFGLYSPDEADAISADELSRWTKATDKADQIPAETVPMTFIHTEIKTDADGNEYEDTVTYYLAKIAKTDANGQILAWRSGLEDPSYIIYELKAPEGYARESEKLVITKAEYDEETLESGLDYMQRTVTNSPGSDTAPAVISLPLTKSVVLNGGLGFAGGTFTFTVEPEVELNPEGDPLEGKVYTYTVDIAGWDDLENTEQLINALAFTQEGRYLYTITETADTLLDEDGNPIEGLSYDTSVYRIAVIVSKVDEDADQLTAVVLATKDGDVIMLDEERGIVFENPYDVPCAVPVTATKVYEGKELQGEDFSFVLESESYTTPEGIEETLDDFPMPEGAQDGQVTVTNDVEGLIDFGEITFTQGGTYIYKMYEVQDTDENIIYDVQEYTVIVVVTEHTADNGSKWLEVSAAYQNDDGYVEEAVFTNEYIGPEDPENPENPNEPKDPNEPGDSDKPEGPEGNDKPDGSDDSDKPNSDVPATGDHKDYVLWMALMCAAGAALVGLIRKKMKWTD